MARASRGTKEKLRVSVRACVGASERDRQRERKREREGGALVSRGAGLAHRRARKFVAACFGAKDGTARATGMEEKEPERKVGLGGEKRNGEREDINVKG